MSWLFKYYCLNKNIEMTIIGLIQSAYKVCVRFIHNFPNSNIIANYDALHGEQWSEIYSSKNYQANKLYTGDMVELEFFVKI